MDNDFKLNDDNTFNLRVNILDLDAIIQSRLVEAAKIIEDLRDSTAVDVWEALMVVIPYFSNAEQLKALADWQSDPEWINIVAGDNA